MYIVSRLIGFFSFVMMNLGVGGVRVSVYACKCVLEILSVYIINIVTKRGKKP